MSGEKTLPFSIQTEVLSGIELFGDVRSFEQIGWSKGTNPGGIFREPTFGKELYVKRYSDYRQSACEFISNRIYALGGAPVLRGYLIKDGETLAYATEYQRDLKKLGAEKRGLAKDIFVLSAFLLDWDAVGTGPENPYGNLQEDGQGNFILVDHGGSLLFRGLSGLKESDNLVFDSVPELETLRSPLNPRAQAIFQSITSEEMKSQIKALMAGVSEASIREIIEQGRLRETKGLVEGLLISRRRALADYLGKYA